MPVDQRTSNDCLRCCVATVLGLRYEEVGDFAVARQAEALIRWAATKGLAVVYLQACGDGEMISVLGSGLWIASGPTFRGTRHAVVYRGPELVHDPHPSRSGLLRVEAARVLVPAGGPFAVPRNVADIPTAPIDLPR